MNLRLEDYYAELPTVLDASALANWKKCQRIFLFKKNNKLRSASESIHLTAGGAFASGIEAYRRAIFIEGTSHYTAMEKAFLAASLKWADFGHDELKTKTKPFSSVIKAIHAYVTKMPPKTDHLTPIFERIGGEPSVEFSFALPLDDFPSHPNGDPFILAGRFDLLARDKRTQKVVWVDEKTTYSLGAGWGDQWRLRFQFLTYNWALRRLGYNVNNGFVRGIGMLKTRTEVVEQPVSFPSFLLDEYEAHLRVTIHSIVNAYHTQYYDPNYGDNCVYCDFRPLCVTERASNWRSLFETDTWDPLGSHEERKDTLQAFSHLFTPEAEASLPPFIPEIQAIDLASSEEHPPILTLYPQT